MITLLLEDYCQEGCRMFKPVVNHDIDIFIKCEWAAQCRYLRNYLRRTGGEHGKEKIDEEDNA